MINLYRMFQYIQNTAITLNSTQQQKQLLCNFLFSFSMLCCLLARVTTQQVFHGFKQFKTKENWDIFVARIAFNSLYITFVTRVASFIGLPDFILITIIIFNLHYRDNYWIELD